MAPQLDAPSDTAARQSVFVSKFSSVGVTWVRSLLYRLSGSTDDQLALSSTNVPTGSLLHGDFSRLLVAQWEDGLQIDVDPFTNFQSAFITVRLCVAVDFAVASPLSFSILTGVTK
jgi:hypothetical protein